MEAILNTRDCLLRTLRIQGPLTATQLSEHLDIGSTAVRQHLDRLQAEGWIEIVGLRRGVGRPGHLYALTPQADRLFPQHYDHLALDLMEAIVSLPNGHNLLRDILTVRREKWDERYGPLLADKTLSERVRIVKDILDEQGHMADYRAQPDGTYLLTEHHCSVYQVSSRYPLLCQQDLIWLEQALQAQVKLLQSRSTGGPRCLFQIIPHVGQSSDENGNFPVEGR